MSLHSNVREAKTGTRLVFLASLVGAIAAGIGGHKWHTRGMSEPERAFFNRYITVSVLQASGLWGIQNQVGIVTDTQKAITEFRQTWPRMGEAWDRLALQIIFYLPLGGGGLAGAGAAFLIFRKKRDAQPPAAPELAVKKPWNKE